MKRKAAAVAVGALFFAPAAHAQIVFGNEQLGTLQIYGKLYPQFGWARARRRRHPGTPVSTLVATAANCCVRHRPPALHARPAAGSPSTSELLPRLPRRAQPRRLPPEGHLADRAGDRVRYRHRDGRPATRSSASQPAWAPSSSATWTPSTRSTATRSRCSASRAATSYRRATCSRTSASGTTARALPRAQDELDPVRDAEFAGFTVGFQYRLTKPATRRNVFPATGCTTGTRRAGICGRDAEPAFVRRQVGQRAVLRVGPPETAQRFLRRLEQRRHRAFSNAGTQGAHSRDRPRASAPNGDTLPTSALRSTSRG